MSRRVAPIVIAVVVSLVAAACDSTEPRGPGSIFISSSASNPEPGSSFYQYEIVVNNGTPRIANVFETTSYIVNGLAAGAHEVRLDGVPTTCDVGNNPRNVTLRGDDTALVVFNIQCQRTTGDLRVNISTTGPDPDPNGYLLLLGNFGSTFMPTNIQTTLPFFPAGTHSLSLSDIASNCTYGGPQSVTVTAGQLATVTFAVTCTPVAVVKVNTTTTGSDSDVDGYIMTVGSGPPARIPTNGTAHVRVANGSNTWQLRDIQPNCAVSGGTSGTVDVPAGDTVTVDATVTCTTIGYGTAGTLATDASGDTLANSGSSAVAHDLLQLTTRYETNWLILVMRFGRAVGTIGSGQGLFGVVDLDVDEATQTGAPPLINAFGGSAQQGSDNRLDLFTPSTESVVLLRALSTDSITHRVPLVIEGDSVIVKIPLEKLNGDDGRLSISAVFGTEDRPTDIAPNAGVILARPSTSLLAGRSAIRASDTPVRTPKAEWPPAKADFKPE